VPHISYNGCPCFPVRTQHTYSQRGGYRQRSLGRTCHCKNICTCILVCLVIVLVLAALIGAALVWVKMNYDFVEKDLDDIIMFQDEDDEPVYEPPPTTTPIPPVVDADVGPTPTSPPPPSQPEEQKVPATPPQQQVDNADLEPAAPRVRATDRFNLPTKRKDTYRYRKGDLVPTRNVTDLELYDMGVHGVNLRSVFRRMDHLRDRGHGLPKPACVAHHQVVLQGRTCEGCGYRDGRPTYRTTALNLVSIYLGTNSTPNVVHAVNIRPFGWRNRPLKSDVKSMRRPDRKRILTYPESGWFEFYDADTEGMKENIRCYASEEEGGSCKFVTTEMRLRGFNAFCVFLALDEMAMVDPFLS